MFKEPRAPEIIPINKFDAKVMLIVLDLIGLPERVIIERLQAAAINDTLTPEQAISAAKELGVKVYKLLK